VNVEGSLAADRSRGAGSSGEPSLLGLDLVIGKRVSGMRSWDSGKKMDLETMCVVLHVKTIKKIVEEEKLGLSVCGPRDFCVEAIAHGQKIYRRDLDTARIADTHNSRKVSEQLLNVKDYQKGKVINITNVKKRDDSHNRAVYWSVRKTADRGRHPL
jgi:hypothetical protein